MREELNSSIGLYSPSFLKMHIDVDESLDDIFKLSPRTSAAFLHEYVHFLQDILTVYGQKNIISTVDYIKSVNINQRNSSQRLLRIPYIPEEKREPGAYYNGELQKVHIGTVSETDVREIIEIKTVAIPRLINNAMVNVEMVELLVTKGHSLDQVSYKFGSHAILESMAFYIEQQMYPGVIEESDNFCYKAAQEVVRFCYPSLLDNPINLIALCDASLMYYNPAAVFYNMLIEMKGKAYVPKSSDDIYRFVHENTFFDFWGLTRIDHIFNNHTLTAFDSINDYFTTEILAVNKEWIKHTFIEANKFRSNEWGFFITLATGGPINENITFKRLFAALGMPMVTNRTANAFFASPIPSQAAVRPDILWAINQICNIYLDSKKSQIRRCAMEDWCRESCRQSNIEDYTDYRCIESPWERVKDENDLCVFSQVWKTWGMENEIPSSK